MAAVRSKDTAPELRVRKALHALGYRFRIHRSDLPGKPDVVLPKYRIILFVHGCFWHGHSCSRGKRKPATRADYWEAKVRRNQERDDRNAKELERQGWRVITLWECQLVADQTHFTEFFEREVLLRIAET
jgi:DNA mismatch endonuclease, patch repair protein